VNEPQVLGDVAHHHAFALPLTMTFGTLHGREYEGIGHGLKPTQLDIQASLISRGRGAAA
jgi:hypothetical protein